MANPWEENWGAAPLKPWEENWNSRTPGTPGNTPAERRAYLQAHPEQAKQQRAEAIQEWRKGIPNNNDSAASRFLSGVISPVSGAVQDLVTYFSDPAKWSQQKGAPGLTGSSFIPLESQVGQAASGDVAGALGGAAGQALITGAQLKAAGPKMMETQSAGERLAELKPGTPRTPIDAFTRGVKPRAANLKFESEAGRALPLIKKAEDVLGQEIASLDDVLEALKIAKQREWTNFEKHLGPGAAAGLVVSGDKIADAIEGSISPRTAMMNPQRAEQVRADAAKYRGRQIPIREAEELLHGANAELDGFQDQYPHIKRARLASNPQTASVFAEGEALRRNIYSTLDQYGNGAGPREAKLNYGALLNVEEELYRRRNVSRRQQPDSLVEQAGKLSAAGDVIGGLVTGHPVSGAMLGYAKYRASKYIKDAQTTDALIRDTFRSLGPGPQPVAVRGLLGEGAIRQPAVPDGSYVRGVDAMPAPLNPARALPPATTHFTSPVDTSGITVTSGPSIEAALNTAAHARFMRPWRSLSGAQQQLLIAEYQRGQLGR